MRAMIDDMSKNYELEQFRTLIESKYPHAPFSGLNMGPVGQLSRTLNKVFTPITHPLLPMIAAPGQISAAEINSRLHSMGNLQKLDMYAIGNVSANGQAMFLEKCVERIELATSTALHGKLTARIYRASYRPAELRRRIS